MSSQFDSQFRTFDVPADSDSFAITEYTWPFTGTLDTNLHLAKHHSHIGHFHYSLLIAATAAELGLDAARFHSVSGCDAVPTSQAGFTSNKAMLAHLTARFPSFLSFEADEPSRLLCRADGSVERVDDDAISGRGPGWFFDRR